LLGSDLAVGNLVCPTTLVAFLNERRVAPAGHNLELTRLLLSGIGFALDFGLLVFEQLQ
jgi:hypothetical protein